MKPGRVAFTVPGEPRGKGRPRALAKIRYLPDGSPEAYVQMVTPPDTRDAESKVRAAFRARYPDHRPFTGPVLLRFTAVFETPASFNKALKAAAARGELHAIKKPDKDNIEKLIVDALNHVVFMDDQQVMGGGMKRYGTPARLEISFEPLGGVDVPQTPGERRNERRQRELPMHPDRALKSNVPKSDWSERRIAPDLSAYPSHTRERILAAMARDDAARRGKP